MKTVIDSIMSIYDHIYNWISDTIKPVSKILSGESDVSWQAAFGTLVRGLAAFGGKVGMVGKTAVISDMPGISAGVDAQISKMMYGKEFTDKLTEFLKMVPPDKAREIVSDYLGNLVKEDLIETKGKSLLTDENFLEKLSSRSRASLTEQPICLDILSGPTP